MKYVLFMRPDDVECFLMFPDLEKHHDVARRYQEIGWKLLSAGEVSFGCDGRVSCAAKSVSLQLSYNKERSQEDTEIIQNLIDL